MILLHVLNSFVYTTRNPNLNIWLVGESSLLVEDKILCQLEFASISSGIENKHGSRNIDEMKQMTHNPEKLNPCWTPGTVREDLGEGSYNKQNFHVCATGACV